ncbi:MAG: DUF1549 domain-containing protein [Verrucomicrobiae bacterium]|nr:DUF1549 domain-containing protein [Verrucomicrobiae bacterium]
MIPPKPPAIPEVRQTGWASTDIDRFVLAKLETAKLAPAPPAEPLTLLRRLTFDLTGLPRRRRKWTRS